MRTIVGGFAGNAPGRKDKEGLGFFEPSASEEDLFDADAAVAQALARGDIVVPPYPAVAIQLNRLINSDNYDVARLAEVVSMDPAASARIVGVSNSARFARPAGEVTTVEQAVSLLGASEVAQIAMAGGLSDGACSTGPLESLKYLVWRQSVYTALASKHLAPGRRVDPAEALLCGLLIGLGRTVTLACVERGLAKHREAVAWTAEQWMAIVERHQSAVGVYVAHKWEVPSIFVQILASLSEGESPSWAGAEQGKELRDLVLTMTQCVQILERAPVPDQGALRAVLRSDEECERLLQFAPGLPALLNAMTAERSRPPRRRPRKPVAPQVSVVLPEAVVISGDLWPLCCAAQLKRSRGDVSLRLEQIGYSGAILLSPESFKVNWVTRVVVQCKPAPVDLWVTVRSSAPAGDQFRIEVQPFALSGDPAQQWGEAVGYARNNPPPAVAEGPPVASLPPPTSARRPKGSGRYPARTRRKR